MIDTESSASLTCDCGETASSDSLLNAVTLLASHIEAHHGLPRERAENIAWRAVQAEAPEAGTTEHACTEAEGACAVRCDGRPVSEMPVLRMETPRRNSFHGPVED